MKKYVIKIKGSTPLIWNVMKKELRDEITKLKKNEMDEWENKRENWVRKAECNNGEVIIPSRWIKANLIKSAKGTGIVPHFATTKRATYTSYCESLFISDGERVCLEKQLRGFGEFVGARGKNSDTKVWRMRPILDVWKTSFTISDPSGRMKKDELKELLDFGGMFVGYGDNRKNNFGRFEVLSIEEAK